MSEPLPFALKRITIVNDEFAGGRGVDSSFNVCLGHFRDRFPVSGNLRPVLRAQDVDLVALDAIGFPIENEPFRFGGIEQRKIDNSLQRSALVHFPEEWHFGMKDRLSIRERSRKIRELRNSGAQ